MQEHRKQTFVIHVYRLGAPGNHQETLGITGPFESAEEARSALRSDGWNIDADEMVGHVGRGLFADILEVAARLPSR